MSHQDSHLSEYSDLRNIHKYYIDSYNTLYQLKTKNEEELNSIYKIIKTELIDSKKYPPESIIRDILNIIPYNNRYTKSYLALAKHLYDDYHVKNVNDIEDISRYLFYKEYGILLGKYVYFDWKNFKNLDIHSEYTIYRAIMDNDLKLFISFTEMEGFDKNQLLKCDLYPNFDGEFSLLELCSYHGAADCFKFLRTKFNSEITFYCLALSFLRGNPEIMSECLKYNNTYNDGAMYSISMEYAIISHNIDFVTYLMNEHNLKINLNDCIKYKNLESFLVYFDQTNDVNKCFKYSINLDIPSICEYFISKGANINEKYNLENTALHYAALFTVKK